MANKMDDGKLERALALAREIIQGLNEEQREQVRRFIMTGDISAMEGLPDDARDAAIFLLEHTAKTAHVRIKPMDKKEKAILQARDELLTLSLEEKEAVKKALAGDAAALDSLPQDIKGQFAELRGLMNYSEAIKKTLMQALDAPQAKILDRGSFPPRGLDIIVDGVRNLDTPERQRIAGALKECDAAALNSTEQQLFAVLSFIITITDDDTRNKLGEILELTADDVARITAYVAPTGKVILSSETDKQPLLPFVDWGEDSRERVNVDMTQGTHGNTISFAISKLAQKAPELIPGKERNYNVSVIPAKGKREEIGISVMVDMPKEIEVPRHITLFDRMVEDAIGNLADDGYIDANGIMAISPEMVYRQINGLADGERVSKNGVSRVNESIKKLAMTWCKIDYTAHLKAVNGKDTEDLKKVILGRNIIKAEQIIVKFGNKKEVTGWKIHGRPVIYEYSKAVHQIATVKRQVLASAAVNNTPEVMQMRYYLLQQIERIHNKPGKQGNPDILFDSIFEATGDSLPLENTPSGRMTRAKRIKAIKIILYCFKKGGLISGWREVGKGNRGQKTGLEIDIITRDKGKR